MEKFILFILGIISALYGVLVLQASSGTKFWLVWELVGIFFIAWAALLHVDFFASHKIIKIIFHAVILMGITVLIILCSMIAGKFNAKGEKNLDYIIVLGAQMRENGPSPVLRYRLDEAIEYLDANPDTICIVSGGQGPNEPYPEAEGMAAYLIDNGIDSTRILLENTSQTTAENIENSKKLMKESYNGVGIVTNNFHMFRALRIAQAQGLRNVSGISADSNTLYIPNNVLRECGGILKNWLLHNL